MQRLGLPKAELREPVRQETDKMTQAVRLARLQNYDGSLSSLDRVMTADDSEKLSVSLVADWTRLSPERREKTNILVLDNDTRLIVNTKYLRVLKKEMRRAAEETRLNVLAPSGNP